MVTAYHHKAVKGKSSMVQKIVHQAVGYQTLYRCKYAILTNYICTWAIKLSNGVAYISPGFNFLADGPMSTLSMVFFVLCRAAEEAISSPNWNNPALRTGFQKAVPGSKKSMPVKNRQGKGSKAERESSWRESGPNRSPERRRARRQAGCGRFEA